MTSRGTGVQPMRGYRLYFMDQLTGHIAHRREFLADDDSAAMTIATGWATGQPMELWLDSHKLKRWEAVQNGDGHPFLAANCQSE